MRTLVFVAGVRAALGDAGCTNAISLESVSHQPHLKKTLLESLEELYAKNVIAT